MSSLRLRAQGPLADVDPATLTALLGREPLDESGIALQVADLIADVRARGDVALREMARLFDGAEMEALEVPRTVWDEAVGRIDVSLRRALERASANIRRFHEAQLPSEVTVEVEPGVVVTRMWQPLSRVGVYAPGGTAAYPSSVLMGVVPARAAGVEEIVLCSPPGPDGRPSDAVLAAAAIAGADRLFAIGGAGAVAAMAYGTASIAATDAIVGPGNRWVTEAKRQVAGTVVIDAPAGPSEVLVLADEFADANLAALEMLAQAEHGSDSVCILVTTSARLARAAAEQLDLLLEGAPRASLARLALETSGAMLVSESMLAAEDFTSRFAPEHLVLLTSDAAAQARRIRNAGTIFVGPASSVAFGDYMTGANHVLPTGGRARSFSGLSAQHFLRSFTVQQVSEQGARGMAGDVALLAAAEGLPAHAQAAEARARS